MYHKVSYIQEYRWETKMNATQTVQTCKIFKRSLDNHEDQFLLIALHTSRLMCAGTSFCNDLFVLLCEKLAIYTILNSDQNKVYKHGLLHIQNTKFV